MFMNIIVGIMAVIACVAGIWGFAVDHKKDHNSPNDTSTISDTAKKAKQ